MLQLQPCRPAGILAVFCPVQISYLTILIIALVYFYLFCIFQMFLFDLITSNLDSSVHSTFLKFSSVQLFCPSQFFFSLFVCLRYNITSSLLMLIPALFNTVTSQRPEWHFCFKLHTVMHQSPCLSHNLLAERSVVNSMERGFWFHCNFSH